MSHNNLQHRGDCLKDVPTNSYSMFVMYFVLETALAGKKLTKHFSRYSSKQHSFVFFIPGGGRTRLNSKETQDLASSLLAMSGSQNRILQIIQILFVLKKTRHFKSQTEDATHFGGPDPENRDPKSREVFLRNKRKNK